MDRYNSRTILAASGHRPISTPTNLHSNGITMSDISLPIIAFIEFVPANTAAGGFDFFANKEDAEEWVMDKASKFNGSKEFVVWYGTMTEMIHYKKEWIKQAEHIIEPIPLSKAEAIEI